MTALNVISPDDAEEYTQSLALSFAGSYRLVLWAKRMGIPDALGMSTPDWVQERLGGYIRMSIDERREAARQLTADEAEGGEGLSQTEAAEVLGVSQPTVSNDLRPEPISSDSEPDDDGEWPKASSAEEVAPTPEPISSDSEPDDDGEAADWLMEIEPPEENDGEAQSLDAMPEPESAPAAEPASAGAHVGKNSGDNEWYTPAKYIKSATAVMGGIDLDPASSDAANEVVGAAEHYTEDDDGLDQPWAGRIWMNPPYAQPLVDRFCTRLAREYKAGAIEEACVLVNNATETNWFQEVLVQASAVCFPRGRVKFWHPDKEATPLQGQAVIYLGPHVAEFKAEFLRHGPVGVF